MGASTVRREYSAFRRDVFKAEDYWIRVFRPNTLRLPPEDRNLFLGFLSHLGHELDPWDSPDEFVNVLREMLGRLEPDKAMSMLEVARRIRERMRQQARPAAERATARREGLEKHACPRPNPSA